VPLARPARAVRVVNLGFNTQGAYAFRFTEQDYLYLDYDAVILYEGYNDLGYAPNEYVGRHESPIFRLTGYYPLVHVALMEKAMAMRAGGDIEAAYRGKTVFKPGLASRATAGTLEAAAAVSRKLDEQLDRLSKIPPATPSFAEVHVDALGCPGDWPHYCAGVRSGVRFALDHQKKVLVVTQPYKDERHRDQQAALRTMLAAQFGRDPRVAYVNLGDAVDLRDAGLVYDGMHLTPAGNERIARQLVGPVVALMPEAFTDAAVADAAQSRRSVSAR